MSALRDISSAQRLLKRAFPALVFSAKQRLSDGQVRGAFLEWCVGEKQFVRDAGLVATRQRCGVRPERTLIFGFDDERAVCGRDTDGLLKSTGVAYVALLDDPSGLRERIAEKIKDLLRSDVGGLAPDAGRRNAEEFGRALRDGVWHRVNNIQLAITAGIRGLRAEARETRQAEYQVLARQPAGLFVRERKALAVLVERYHVSSILPDVDARLKALDATLQSAAKIHTSLVRMLQSGYSDEKCRRVLERIQLLSKTIEDVGSLVQKISEICAGTPPVVKRTEE